MGSGRVKGRRWCSRLPPASKIPVKRGTYSVGYAIVGPVSNIPGRGGFTTLDSLATVAKISLSRTSARRGSMLTVTGVGFNNGTTAAVYVLNDPSVTSSTLDDGAAEAALCQRIIQEGTHVGGALVGSDDKVAVTFEVYRPAFGPGSHNYICMVDGEGQMSDTDVEQFHLAHSAVVVPSTASVGDTVTVFAQDFPNPGASLRELRVAGRTVAVTSSQSVDAGGSATATFSAPQRPGVGTGLG